MLVWRLTPSRHVSTALTGDGASLYGGRWNRKGSAVVYLSASLALATLEVVVHITGGTLQHTAIALDLPDEEIERLDDAALPGGWIDDEPATQAIGSGWLGGGRLALAVPSAVVDRRAEAERNFVVDPAHPRWRSVVEVCRFETEIDARLG
ncbi:MAG: RES family NAD+ phosphorylase [Actinomycetota bacterium]|jgi:RES domain-containing protein